MSSNKKKKTNFFEKIYRSLEKKYYSICDWFTKKGIKINKVNTFLQKKNMPPFPFVTSIFILLIFILVYLIFFAFSSSVNIDFNITDYDNVQLDNVSLKITNEDNKEIFKDVLTDSNYDLPLKMNNTYNFMFSKQGYIDLEYDYIVSSKEDTLNLKMEKDYDYGTLSITILDNDTKKKINDAKAVYEYSINGSTESKEIYSDEESSLDIYAPIGKEISITITLDGYQDRKISHILSSVSEERTEYMSVDSASFSGEISKLSIVVSDLDANPVSGCLVEILDNSGLTLDVTSSDDFGVALFDVETGKTIRFTVKKDGYKTFDSDSKDITYRIIKDEEKINIQLEPGGANLRVVSIDKETNIPINKSIIKVYNLEGNLIDQNITNASGAHNFKGLDTDTNYYVSVCAENFLCKQKSISLDNTNNVDFLLDKLKTDNSQKIDIWVYDIYNNPIENAKINIYKIIEDKEIPLGIDPLIVDVSGYATLYLETGYDYNFVGISGDSLASEVLNVGKFSNNKVILIIDDYSRLLTLNLVDENSDPITNGNIKITTYDGTILLDQNTDGSGIQFPTEGYKDLTFEYTDQEGNKTTFKKSVPEQKENMIIEIPKESDIATGNSPIIDFVSVENLEGENTNFITPNEYYYLVFNVIFPENTKQGGVHIRAGLDEVNDSESQSYGIYGFKADTDNFLYSTTYNPKPLPGVSSIDYLNKGSSLQQNKWLQLEWNDSKGIASKQIRVKIKAEDDSLDKLTFKYRAWVEDSGKVYRDPKDSELLDNLNTDKKQSLYAETKEILIDLFEVPANCVSDFCVSYEFIDEDNFNYTADDFFAVQGNIYALKATLFSYKNKEISLKAETSTINPIISFVSTDNKLQFPKNYNFDTLSQLDLKQSNISLNAGVKKNLYIFFIAKNLGNSYIESEFSGTTINTIKEKFSFKVLPEKEMDITFEPSNFLGYDSKLNINIIDKEDKTTIENAIINIKDPNKAHLQTIKGNKLNGINGNYVFTNKYNYNKLIFDIKAYGYKKYTKELLIAQDGYLKGKNSLQLNIGEGQTITSKDYIISNTSNQPIKDIRFESIFINDQDFISIDVDKKSTLAGNSSANFKIIVSKKEDYDFKSINADLIIYGFIGNKQVAKKIDLLIVSGQVENNCLIIKPSTVDFSLGERANSQNTQQIIIQNTCDTPQLLDPEIIKPISNKDDGLEFITPDVTINSGATINYDLTIKNKRTRKTDLEYNYNIRWYNPNYIIKNTNLNISFFNMDNVLKVYPVMKPVTLSQTTKSEPAIRYSDFVIVNEGQIPLKYVQISKESQYLESNMAIELIPSKKDFLKPGETFNLRIKYEGKFNDQTYDDMIYNVSAQAPGTNASVSTKFKNIFLMSGAECIKVTPSNLTFNLNIGESEDKDIVVYNNCAENLTIYPPFIDKKDSLFIQTFGNNDVSFIPFSNNNNMIYKNTSSKFTIRVNGRDYTDSHQTPVRLVGRTTSGLSISSEPFTITTVIEPKFEDQLKDYYQTRTSYIPVCEDIDNQELALHFPTVSENCTSDKGYCDGYSAAKLILSKINSLQKQVITASNHLDNKTENTECEILTDPAYNYCSIENIQSDLKPINFTLYLQNDVVSPKLINEILRKDILEGSNKYSNINMFLVTPYVGEKTSGLGFLANKLHFPSNIGGCGKYEIEITGAISSTYYDLQPKRAYYFVKVKKAELTDQCTKNIENVFLYTPLDSELRSNTDLGTWEIMFTGNKDVSEKVSEKLFENKERFVKNLSQVGTSNVLEIKIDDIKEKEGSIAKLEFNDKVTTTRSKPEHLILTINKDYLINNSLPENFIDRISSIVASFVKDKELSDVCVSENKDYLLINSLIDLGEFSLNIKDGSTKLEVKNEPFCKDFVVKSSISENVFIDTTDLDNLADIYYKYKDKEYNKLNISLQENKAEEFSVCVKPKVLVNYLVDEKIDVVLKSRYSSKGSTGFREESKQLLLTSCGVTPLDTIKGISSEVEKMNTQKENRKYNVLLNWDNSYNSENYETICNSLQKYLNQTKNNVEISPAGIAGCQLELPSAYKQSELSRAVNNGGKFFGGCMAGCVGCQIASNAGLMALGVGVFTFMNSVFDCFLTCGIISGTYILRNSHLSQDIKSVVKSLWGSVKVAFNDLIGVGVGNDNVNQNFNVKEISSTLQKDLQEKATLVEESGGTMLATGAGVGLLRGTRTNKLDAVLSASDDLASKTISTSSTITPAKAISESRYLNYKSYILNSKSAAYKFIPEGLTPDEITRFNNIKSQLSSPTASIKTLVDDDKKFLSKVLKKGKFEGQKPRTPGWNPANSNRFADDLVSGSAIKTIDNADELKTVLTSQKSSLVKARDEISKKMGKSTKSKSYKTLKSQLDEVDNAITKTDDLTSMIDDTGRIAADKVDDFSTKFNELQTSTSKLNKFSRVSKFANIGLGIGKGILCSAAGTVSGGALLEITAEKGVLNKVYEFRSDITRFEKNEVYTIDITRQEVENGTGYGFIIDIYKAEKMLDQRLDHCSIEEDSKKDSTENKP